MPDASAAWYRWLRSNRSPLRVAERLPPRCPGAAPGAQRAAGRIPVEVATAAGGPGRTAGHDREKRPLQLQ